MPIGTFRLPSTNPLFPGAPAVDGIGHGVRTVPVANTPDPVIVPNDASSSPAFSTSGGSGQSPFGPITYAPVNITDMAGGGSTDSTSLYIILGLAAAAIVIVFLVGR